MRTPSNPERWARVKALFFEACELPESERIAHLEKACADDAALLREVVSLLENEKAATDLWEAPAADTVGTRGPPDPPPVPRLQPGTALDAYQITSFLSAGGMGEVYRARHTVLGRPVAIKTVNPRLVDADAKRRLIREARHASVLDHPNICAIHEVGEAGGAPYIVMALVEGRSLSETIREAVPPLGVALDYGAQVADALEHAHQHGIVHRDLKSSNIMIGANGRPVVLDFGLAKRLPGADVGASGESTVTGGGMLAGTLSHMAPELLRGDAADPRSDVWSLGVLLYELVAGTLPFSGETPFETASAILSEPPNPLKGRIPLAVRLVIERCLVKDPGGRYQSAADVRNALEAIRWRRSWPLIGRLLVRTRRRTLQRTAAALAVAIGLASVGPRVWPHLAASPGGGFSTLAFLPLESEPGDPEAAFHAAGLTFGIVGHLGAATESRVVSPASAAWISRTAASPAEVARRLRADAIVTGRVRHSPGRVAIDIRLIDASRDRLLWSDTYERTEQQILSLEADVVRGLAAQVRLAVRPGAFDRLATVRAVNPEAYEAYLRGRYEWNQRTPASLQNAVTHFTASAELDPTYAPALAALADCYNQFATVMLGMGSPREYRPRAAAAAVRALQIDPYSAEAHAALGYTYHYEWRFDEAEQQFLRAIELNPSFPLARIWYANLLMSRGRLDEALKQVNAGRDLDPFSLVVNTNVGWVLAASGRLQDAIVQLNQTLELDSTYIQARSRLVGALLGTGRFTEAREQAVRLVELSGRASYPLGDLIAAEVAMGRIAEARALLEELLHRARQGYVPPFALAEAHAVLGDADEAMRLLGQAFEERSNGMVYLRSTRSLERLQVDPRFEALIGRVGSESERREVPR